MFVRQTTGTLARQRGHDKILVSPHESAHKHIDSRGRPAILDETGRGSMGPRHQPKDKRREERGVGNREREAERQVKEERRKTCGKGIG